MEVFFIGNKVGDICFLSKRRTADFRRAGLVTACLDLDGLAGLRGNGDVFKSINSLSDTRGSYRAAGYDDVAVGINAVAVGVAVRGCGLAAGGRDLTVTYGDVSHVGVYAYAVGVTVCTRSRNFAAGDGDIATGVDAVASCCRYVALSGNLDRRIRPYSGA